MSSSTGKAKGGKKGKGRGGSEPRYKAMSHAEMVVEVATRTFQGAGPAEIGRELGYANHSRVSQLLRLPEVQDRIDGLRRGVLLPPAGEGGEGVEGTIDLPEVKELALLRLAEVLRYGTYLNRPVDPKDGLKAIYEALDRNAETSKVSRSQSEKKSLNINLTSQELEKLNRMALEMGFAVTMPQLPAAKGGEHEHGYQA